MTTTASTTEPRSGAARVPSLLTDGDLPPEQHFIDGAFQPAVVGRFIDVVDPANESVFARVPARHRGRRRRAVAAARAAQPAWAH